MNTERVTELLQQRAAIDAELAELKKQAKAEIKAAFTVDKPKRQRKPKGTTNED
jgi:hypothetical protein